MGFGFLESVYEKCMLIELRKAGLNAESQKPIAIYYEEEIVYRIIKISCGSCKSCQKRLNFSLISLPNRL
jgi:GxxExxY protein